MKESNDEQKIQIKVIKKLNILNNEPKNDYIEHFVKLRKNEIKNFQKNSSMFLLKKNKFQKSINNIVNLSSFINCNSTLNTVNINLIGCINNINENNNYNSISSNVCHMIYHYQNENIKDNSINKYKNNDIEKNIFDEYCNISKKLLMKNKKKNKINNNNETIKQITNDKKKNNIKNNNDNSFSDKSLSIINENEEKKQTNSKKLQGLKKFNKNLQNNNNKCIQEKKMDKYNDLINNAIRVNYSKNSFKKEDLNIQRKLYNYSELNEMSDTNSNK